MKRDLEDLGCAFRAHSDTEVLLAAYCQWGEACLQRLNGMFAFALHDRLRGNLFLARDRVGEKPLFYYHANGAIRFASELKGLLADRLMPRRVDQGSLDCYLSFSYISGERCILEGYRKLPAAHARTFDCGTGDLKVFRYWDLPDLVEADEQLYDHDLEYRLETLLKEAAYRQLVADVPAGLLLSGGVDSSLITALAARTGKILKTFSVAFRDAPDFDESAHAALIARHFGTDHTVLEADTISPDLLSRLARQFDEPIVDSSMIPTFLVTQQISRQCKVALGGDGGDELFGGYNSAGQMAALQQRSSRLPAVLRRAVSMSGGAVLPPGFKGRNFLIHLGTDATCDVLPLMPRFDKRHRRGLLTAKSDSQCLAEEIGAARIPNTRDAVQGVTRFDFMNFMIEDILVKVDRASMLNSLEVRSPFLDRQVIEFAYSQVPSRLKASVTDRKIILKRLAARILPPEFDKKRKQGFGIPIGQWLKRGPWRTMFENALYDPGSTFSHAEVARLFRGLDADRKVTEQSFGLCLFELWRREYSITV